MGIKVWHVQGPILWNFLQSNLNNVRYELVCLSLAGLSGLVQYVRSLSEWSAF